MLVVHYLRVSIVVSISACHADDPGSIPGRGNFGLAKLVQHQKLPRLGSGQKNVKCLDPASNRGPPDLQFDALPTELSRRIRTLRILHLVSVPCLAGIVTAAPVM